MTDRAITDPKPEVKSRAKLPSSRFLPLLLIIVVLLTGGFYLWDKALKGDKPFTFLRESKEENIASHPVNDNTLESSPSIINKSQSPGVQNTRDNSEIVQNENVPQSSESVEASPLANALVSTESTKSQHQTSTSTSFDVAPYVESQGGTQLVDYDTLVQDLNTFYTHLDSQQYMADFDLDEESKIHFSKLIQKLLENPPVVTRETDDMFTLLKNTAHFFRILGKDNITVLKGILDRERGSFEEILKTFYTLTYNPKRLKNEYNLDLDQKALYDYAAFFLNTMGGRLYLFRRDSTSRLAVSFYAILIIDRANQSGDSPHGINIKPAIKSLIEEMENGGNSLKMREEYLDKLYTLEGNYG